MLRHFERRVSDVIVMMDWLRKDHWGRSHRLLSGAPCRARRRGPSGVVRTDKRSNFKCNTLKLTLVNLNKV